ncbi:MAG: 4Fe-4S binding protein [Deltaproteobacteria bacterium]|nr:4Fe-4S binding protein [Deltaproteobacteria bacterium]
MAFRVESRCNGCAACVAFCPVAAIGGLKKEKHNIDNKLCISCGVCGRICPHGAISDDFGIPCRHQKRSLWQKPVCFTEVCVSCGICVSACPTGALRLSGDESSKDKKRIPSLETKKCIACGFCVADCPFEALFME